MGGHCHRGRGNLSGSFSQSYGGLWILGDTLWIMLKVQCGTRTKERSSRGMGSSGFVLLTQLLDSIPVTHSGSCGVTICIYFCFSSSDDQGLFSPLFLLLLVQIIWQGGIQEHPWPSSAALWLYEALGTEAWKIISSVPWAEGPLEPGGKLTPVESGLVIPFELCCSVDAPLRSPTI